MDTLPPDLSGRILAWNTNPILQRCTTGDGGGTQRPFFARNTHDDSKPTFEPRHAHNVPLPPSVQEAMAYFDEDTELYIDDWTIMSVTEMRRIRQEYVARGQNLVQPFAHTYMGMGHVRVLSYDPVHHVAFAYMDGGSSGYDRQDNFEAVCAFDEGAVRQRMVAKTTVPWLADVGLECA